MNKSDTTLQNEPVIHNSATTDTKATNEQSAPREEAPTVSNNPTQPAASGEANSKPGVNSVDQGNRTEEAAPAPVEAPGSNNEARTPEKKNKGSSKPPAKGKTIPDEQLTNPVVQTQPVTTSVAVPDLIGTQLNVAKSILSLNGLTVGTISSIPDPANEGLVIRQIPKPGTQLKKGSTVNLITGSK